MTPKMFIWKVRARIATMFARLLPDDVYLKWIFPARVGYPLDLKNPKTFNEKMQWLKLHDRKPEYTKMVDKIEAKKYVASIIGDEYIIPTIAVYDSVEDIDFDALPQQFVLKCSHDSGGIVICRDKNKLDKKAAIEKLRKGLKQNFYWQNREWPYKNVKPRIIADIYMEDESGCQLKDYKFFCFDGKPLFLFVATDRGKKDVETKFDFFDMEWNHLPFTNGHPNSTILPKKPQNFEKMKQLAAMLAKGKTEVRVDLYNVDGRIYFGELTFTHWSGLVPFEPSEWDSKFGQLISLPKINKIEH